MSASNFEPESINNFFKTPTPQEKFEKFEKSRKVRLAILLLLFNAAAFSAAFVFTTAFAVVTLTAEGGLRTGGPSVDASQTPDAHGHVFDDFWSYRAQNRPI